MVEHSAHTTDEELDTPETPRRTASGRTPIPTRLPPPSIASPGDQLVEMQREEAAAEREEQRAAAQDAAGTGADDVAPAPDEAENGGVADNDSNPAGPRRNRSRNKRHGRKR